MVWTTRTRLSRGSRNVATIGAARARSLTSSALSPFPCIHHRESRGTSQPLTPLISFLLLALLALLVPWLVPLCRRHPLAAAAAWPLLSRSSPLLVQRNALLDGVELALHHRAGLDRDPAVPQPALGVPQQPFLSNLERQSALCAVASAVPRRT